MLSYGAGIWVLMAVEFFERMAYYGTAFSLMVYALSMLNWNLTEANYLINGLYAISPLAALVGSYLGDGPVSRKRMLLVGCVVYMAGLLILAVTAMPMLYHDFPDSPRTGATIGLVCGSLVFGIGYGLFKVSISPLLGDAAVVRFGNDCEMLSKLYRLDYWVFNLGSLVGTLAFPELRQLDGRTKPSGSSTVETGFYYSYWASASATLIGIVVYLFKYAELPQNTPFGTSAIHRVLGRAIYKRTCFACGVTKDSAFHDANKDKGLLEYSSHGVEPGSPQHHEIVNTIPPLRQAFRACKVLSPLPIHWLISTQFTSNVVVQASWLDLPSYVQPEAFNNVNTITLLIFIPLLEAVVLPRMYPNRRPPVIKRMAVGFTLTTIGMVFCAILQIFIAKNGSFNSSGDYTLHEGKHKYSGLWLVGPYVLQGLAGVFIDATALEAAYTISAPSMKSFIVAVYLLASTGSGFLGMLFAPLYNPSTLMWYFIALAVAQTIATIVFVIVVREDSVVEGSPASAECPLLKDEKKPVAVLNTGFLEDCSAA